MTVKALPPGSVIGIMGGGQLGRMLALAAGQLGLKCHIYAPEAYSPAFHVSAAHTVAGYRDEAALARFAEAVDVVTYEFENVPVEAVRFLEARVPVRPGAKALEVAQDRLNEKSLARELGAATAEFAAVNSLADLEQAVAKIGLPAVLKTTRLGYDGKGQAKIMSAADVASAWSAMKGSASILESFVDFEREVSVIAARGLDGSVAAFDVTENVHRNHILHTSTVPARVSEALRQRQPVLPAVSSSGWTMWGSWGWSSSWGRTGSTSTRSLRGCTTPGTGPRMPASSRSSSSISGLLPAGPWARPGAIPTW